MEFHKDNVFVELSDEEREILSKANGIITNIRREMPSYGSPTLDLQHEKYILGSFNDHDMIKVSRFLNAFAINDKNRVTESYCDWDEICKYEENRR
jgi:hypothetical protein